MSEADAIAQGAAALRDAGIGDPLREARMLWRGAFARRYVDYHAAMAGGRAADFHALIARRVSREPMSHVLGYRDFYDHRFVVSGDALDPRPDTETLVAAALEQAFTRVLDLGTGSGCVLLSVLAATPNATGLGTDLSQAALGMARRNRQEMELVARADLIIADWFDGVDGMFDLIVSNPPYIALDEMATLAPELTFEPRMALTDEGDGLTAYRAITTGVMAHLAPGGQLMVEIGPTQGAAVTAMMQGAGLEGIEIRHDLDGRDRVVMGRRHLG